MSSDAKQIHDMDQLVAAYRDMGRSWPSMYAGMVAGGMLPSYALQVLCNYVYATASRPIDPMNGGNGPQ